MPEGHVLHRAARLQTRRFAGRAVEVASPQGRFADGAARLNGQRVSSIDAAGKHLFWWFASGDVLHIHLGLYGKFRTQTAPFPAPSPNARVIITADDDRLHLAGPTACELLVPDDVEVLIARLGPDPLRRPAHGAAEVEQRLARRRIPIAQALLDQKVIAGLGNVYRAELLFLLGIDPFTPAHQVSTDGVAKLWELSVSELRRGERSGRIVTVELDDLPSGGRRTRSRLPRSERLYVYKREGEPCRRCGALIRSAELANRRLWWCPECQPEVV